MKLIEKLKQNNIRNCIDILLITIPISAGFLISEMPKSVDYALTVPVLIGAADIFYRFIYRQ